MDVVLPEQLSSMTPDDFPSFCDEAAALGLFIFSQLHPTLYIQPMNIALDQLGFLATCQFHPRHIRFFGQLLAITSRHQINFACHSPRPDLLPRGMLTRSRVTAEMLAKIVLCLAACTAVAADACTLSGGTFTIDSSLALSNLSKCSSVDGTVVITDDAGTDVDISGPTTINTIEVLNNSKILTLTSNSLVSVDTLKINAATTLTGLSMPKFTKAETIIFTALAKFSSLKFGGVTSATAVTVTDTQLTTLDTLKLEMAGTVIINNNKLLTDISLSLHNVSTNLQVTGNGVETATEVSLSLPNLSWIANFTISNITTLDMSALKVINGTGNIQSNYMVTLGFPNLTSTTSGDLYAFDNSNLQNLSTPVLKSVGGAYVYANNTATQIVNGAPLLETVGGSIKLRGNFSEVSFPSLDKVVGAVDASSTVDLKGCDALQTLKNDKKIGGTFNCAGNNATANSDTSSGTSGSSGSSSNHGNGNNSAAGLTINTAVLIGVAGIAGFAQALW